MAPSLPAWFRDTSKADDEDKTDRKGGRKQKTKTLLMAGEI